MNIIINILLAFSLITSAYAKETWSPKAMLETKLLSDPQLSPDNQSVLFQVLEPKLGDIKGKYLLQIYKNTELFSPADASSMLPRWSPDGKWVAFLSIKEGGKKQLFLIPSSGGEAKPLTKNENHDVQTFAWSPDSSKIAFVMTDEKEKLEKKTSRAHVFQQQTHVNRLWLIDLSSENPIPKPLTTDDYCVRGTGDFNTINAEFDWSPDAKTIVFAFSPGLGFDYFYLDSSLASIDIESGNITAWPKLSEFESLPRYSPDGELVAYLCCESSKRYALNRRVALRTKDGAFKQKLAPTYNGGPYLCGPSILGWTDEGVLFYEPKGTKYSLLELPKNGNPPREIDIKGLFIRDPSLSLDRKHLTFVIQSPESAPEIAYATLSPFKASPLTNLNEKMASYPKTRTELIRWESEDKQMIEGLLTYPLGYVEGKKYPVLLNIHGGPMAFHDETYLGTPNVYPLAALAQEGFFILRPNPRGSTGYGEKFRTANYNDWAGKDFNDLMSGIQTLIDQGLVDPDKMGVMGWSYGGYMTAWTITQTSKFKAASMGAGVSNLVSMDGTTDLHRFLTDYMGEFSKHPELYEERSPINHLLNVKTPLLMQHGTADKRVPVGQSYEFYQGLKRNGKNVTLVLYPEMEHRIFDPNMHLEAMERNLSWFNEIILEKKNVPVPLPIPLPVY